MKEGSILNKSFHFIESIIRFSIYYVYVPILGFLAAFILLYFIQAELNWTHF